MDRDLVSFLLWSALAASLIMSAIGLYNRSAVWMFLASGLALLFSAAAIWSIGFFTLVLAVLQLVTAIAMYRSARRAI